MFFMNFQWIFDTTVYSISLLIIIVVILVKYCTKLFYITVQKYIRHRERHEQSNHGRLKSHQVDTVLFEEIPSDISRPSKRINDQVEEDITHERTKGRHYRDFTQYRNSTSNRQKHESTNIHHHGFQQIPKEYNNKHPVIDGFSNNTSHQQRYGSRINIQGQPYTNINPYLIKHSNNDEMGHNNVFRSYHYLVSTRYREKPRTFKSWSRIAQLEWLNDQIPPSRKHYNVSEHDTNLVKHSDIPATSCYLTPSLSSYFVMKASSGMDVYAEDKHHVERNTFTEDKHSIERNTFTEDKPFLERNTFTEDKPSVERNTFTEDKPFLERNIFTEDKAFLERNTFTEDKPFLERNTFTEDELNTFMGDKPSVERNTFTEDKPFLERNTFTGDKPSVERHTFIEDKPDVERNTFMEGKHDVERNTFTEDKPFLERNIFTEDEPDVERITFTDDKPSVERNTFTDDKHDIEMNTFTDDKHDVERNTFTEDKHDIERNTFAEDKHDVERNTFTEDKHDVERNTFTEDKHDIERNTFAEDKHDVERNIFTEDKLFLKRNTFTEDKPFVERNTFTEDKPFVEKNTFTEDKHDTERKIFTEDDIPVERNTFTEDKPFLERNVITVDKTKNTFTVIERNSFTEDKADVQRDEFTNEKLGVERTAHTVYKPDGERTAHTVYKPDGERTTHTVCKPDRERTTNTVCKPDGERATQDKQGRKGTSFIAAEYVTSELQITNRKRCIIYDDSVSPAVDSKVRKCSSEVKVVTSYGERQINNTLDNFNSTTVRFCDTSHTTTSLSNRCCLTDSLMVPNNTRYQTTIPTVAKSVQCLEEGTIHNNNSKKTNIHVAADLFQQAVAEEFHSLPNFSSVGIPEITLRWSQSGSKGQIHTVVFDLETTGLGNNAQIVQLAAQKQDDHFNKYIVPTRPINPEASEVTGLYTDGATLYHNDCKMKTERKMSCLNSFIDWLPDNTILCAHNCKRFDATIIVSEITSVNLMTNFKRKVIGFIDTLPLFKVNLPGWKSYKQTSLVTDILGETYEAHEAMDDTRLLLKLLTSKNIRLSGFFEHSFTIESVEKYLCDFKRKKDCLRTFKQIIEAKVMTESMADKAAKTDLRFNDLILAAKGDNVDGLFDLLSKPNESDGKPRLTKSTSVIMKIYEFIRSMD